MIWAHQENTKDSNCAFGLIIVTTLQYKPATSSMLQTCKMRVTHAELHLGTSFHTWPHRYSFLISLQ